MAESVIELAIRASYIGVDVANVSHWHIAGGDADPQDLIDELFGTGNPGFDAGWRGAHTTEYGLHIVHARAVWREGEGYVDDAPVEADLTGRNGTRTGTHPIGAALERTATLYTGQTGRRHRGRIRFCSGWESDIEGQVWVDSSGGALSDTDDFMSTVLMPLYGADGSQDFTIGVFSRASVSGTSQSLDDVFLPVSSYRMRDQLRWLRSRMN